MSQSLAHAVAAPRGYSVLEAASHRLELLDAGCARDIARFLTVKRADTSSGCL